MSDVDACALPETAAHYLAFVGVITAILRELKAEEAVGDKAEGAEIVRDHFEKRGQASSREVHNN